MTRKKPAIVICEDFSLWLGNTSDSDSVVEPGELLGFGTGVFEEKVVSPFGVTNACLFLCNFGIASFAHFLSIVIF